MGLQEKALPTEKVAVMRAVFGKTKENHVMEKSIPSFPQAARLAVHAIKKNQIANLKKSLADE